MIFDNIIADLERHEGFESYPYTDTVGVVTFGHGLTYITIDESRHIISGRVREAHKFLSSHDWYSPLSDNRKAVIINMYYNLGNRLFGFKRMISAIKREEWHAAANEMLDSKWARQVKGRAYDLAVKLVYG